MTLTAGLQSGLVSGLQSGLNPGGAASYSLSTLTPADVATILGKPTPTLMYRFDEASGATELVGVVASADMVDVNTPDKEVASAALEITTTSPTFNSSDACAAAASGIGDVSTQSLTGILLLEFGTGVFANQGIVQKREPATGNEGWEIYEQSANSYVSYVCDSDTTISSQTISVDHGSGDAEFIQWTNDRANNKSGVYTSKGSSESTAVTGDMTSSARLGIGSGISVSGIGRSAADFKAGLLLFWDSSDAEGFDGTEGQQLLTELGL